MKIDIVTKDDCSWCEKAKNLLDEHRLLYNVIEYGKDITKQEFVLKAPGVTTVPAVFVNDYYMGGYQFLEENITSINQYILYESTLKVEESVKIIFEKANGEIRTMYATLKPELLPIEEIKESEGERKPRKPSLTSIRCFDLEKKEFRSFRFDSVIDFPLRYE